MFDTQFHIFRAFFFQLFEISLFNEHIVSHPIITFYATCFFSVCFPKRFLVNLGFRISCSFSFQLLLFLFYSYPIGKNDATLELRIWPGSSAWLRDALFPPPSPPRRLVPLFSRHRARFSFTRCNACATFCSSTVFQLLSLAFLRLFVEFYYIFGQFDRSSPSLLFPFAFEN